MAGRGQESAPPKSLDDTSSYVVVGNCDEPARELNDKELAERFTSLTIEQLKNYRELGLTDFKGANSKAKQKIDETLANWIIKRENAQVSRPPSQDEGQALNLILLGRTGAGKSSTGNLILGEESFKYSDSTQSCTKQIQNGICKFDNMTVNIIDCPGFGEIEMSPEDIFTEISKVIIDFEEGIDGMLFVFSMGNPRFTAEQKAAFDAMDEGLFGEGAIDNCFVILTHMETKPSIKSLSSYLEQEQDSLFGQLLKETLDKKVIGVNNVEPTRYGREVQRRNIFALILAERGSRFTTEQFERAKEERRRRESEIAARSELPVPVIKQLGEDICAKLRPLSKKAIKALKERDSKERKCIVECMVKKVIEDNKLHEKTRAKAQGAVEVTLDGLIDQMTKGTSWVDIAELVVMFVMPAFGALPIAGKTAKLFGSTFARKAATAGISGSIGALITYIKQTYSGQ